MKLKKRNTDGNEEKEHMIKNERQESDKDKDMDTWQRRYEDVNAEKKRMFFLMVSHSLAPAYLGVCWFVCLFIYLSLRLFVLLIHSSLFPS